MYFVTVTIADENDGAKVAAATADDDDEDYVADDDVLMCLLSGSI